MSRQSKQAKKKTIARQFTEMHKSGRKGPAQTPSKHGKVASYNVAKKSGKSFTASPSR